MSKIIYTNSDGIVSIITPAGDINDAIKDVPSGVSYEIVDDNKIPTDRTFRNAWVKGSGVVTEDVDRAREIAHQTRREKRAAEFKPNDDIIALNIPGTDIKAAEDARSQTRWKYKVMQDDLDRSKTISELKTALEDS